MAYMPIVSILFSFRGLEDTSLNGKAYYLQLIGTNTSAEDPWVVPEGHSVIGREGYYLIVQIDDPEGG
jgi:hypothetical protein